MSFTLWATLGEQQKDRERDTEEKAGAYKSPAADARGRLSSLQWCCQSWATLGDPPPDTRCCLRGSSPWSNLRQTSGLDAIAQQHLEACEAQVGGSFIPLSFWSDGVPMSWDRNESVQCFTWTLPGLSRKDLKTLRIPFTVLPKHFCTAETIDFVLEFFGWSLDIMFRGFFPQHGLQGAEFEDAYRRNLAGQPLGFRGGLGIFW